MNKLEQKGNELIKHTSAIHISNTISAIERKISNILLKNAFSYLLTKEIHLISLREIMSFLGWSTTNESYDAIKNALKKLNTTQIEWNILGKDKKNKWGVTTIISWVQIEDGICKYSYSPVLRDLLAAPNIYARLNMVVQARFDSKYSLALWEFLVEFMCSGNGDCITTDWIELQSIRRVLGIEKAESYVEFKVLNRNILKKAITEINSVSDITVECRHKKNSRQVIAIAFLASKKDDLNFLPAELVSDKIENENVVSSCTNELVEKLKKEFRFSDKTAQKIVECYAKEEVEKVILYVKEQMACKKVKKVSAYFISALEGRWDFDHAMDERLACDDSTICSEIDAHLQKQELPWKAILLLLKDIHGNLVYHTWFTKITFVKYDDERRLLQVKADTAFYQDWIENNYKQKLLEAARLIIPQVSDLEITS